jgi:uncharacterized protein (TIGR00730 family)
MGLGIFCGSSVGESPIYRNAACDMASELVRRKIALVFGGARVGLMGVIADAVLARGGEAIGVIPKMLIDREIAHESLTELHVVESMHERKLKMADLSDGFIALPGGAGTVEEIVEQWTWAQLGIHHKPCALLNVNGFFDPLLVMIERMAAEGFLKRDYADMLLIEKRPETLLDRLEAYRPPVRKWLNPKVDREIKCPCGEK